SPRAPSARALVAPRRNRAAPLSARRREAHLGPLSRGSARKCFGRAASDSGSRRRRASSRRGGVEARLRRSPAPPRKDREPRIPLSPGAADHRQSRADLPAGLRKDRRGAQTAHPRLGGLRPAVRGGGVRAGPVREYLLAASSRSISLLALESGSSR